MAPAVACGQAFSEERRHTQRLLGGLVKIEEEAQMAVQSSRQTGRDTVSRAVAPRWKALSGTGGVAALSMLALMIVQIIVYMYMIWPPPTTVESYFRLFDESWLLGPLSLDLLYLVDTVPLVLIYLALYVVLRSAGEPAMLVAAVLGIVGVAAYFASNPAFDKMSLIKQYKVATTEAERTALTTVGQAMLEMYTGTAFDVYCVLKTIVFFLISPVMLRSGLFTRLTASLGLAPGFLMIVPSSAGILGLYFSLASLVPWAAWLWLVARRLRQYGRGR